jgi:hypothetical protein
MSGHGIIKVMRAPGYVWVFVAALGARTADAGRYCGSDETLAPGEGSTLPIAPTIAMHVEDAYFEGKRQHRAVATTLKITLDGTPVKFTTKDVRVADGLIRYITIQSKKPGTLVIESKKPDEGGEHTQFGTYTIAESWMAPAKGTAVVTAGIDRRLSVYRVVGHYTNVRVDVPAISYSLRWRKSAKAKWRTVLLPAAITRAWAGPNETNTANSSEAHLGSAICGGVDTVPGADLTAGVEIELTAKLPNGKTLPITNGIATPFVAPPAPRNRDDDPLSP